MIDNSHSTTNEAIVHQRHSTTNEAIVHQQSLSSNTIPPWKRRPTSNASTTI
jgi:hypothetical protein